MHCSLFGPTVVACSLTVSRQITGAPLKNDVRYCSLSLALQFGVHLQRGDRERAPLPQRLIQAPGVTAC